MKTIQKPKTNPSAVTQVVSLNTLKIIGYTKDERTNTNVVYAQINISEYLTLVGNNFDRFEIQRRREQHSAYKRMKEDIINGALLPTITLAVNPEVAQQYIELASAKNSDGLIASFNKPNDIYILDGLQRTYIISDIHKEGAPLKPDQTLLLEFWLESEIKHLIYRLIVLNAGQKPMSMRHQVELLFMTMQQKLEHEITGLSIYSEREQDKRTKPSKFAFDRLVTAYYSFMTKSPEIKRENIVVQEMNEKEVMDSSEDRLGLWFTTFTDVLKRYCALDNEAFRVYASSSQNTANNVTGSIVAKNWFADENVMNSFFAAVASFSHDDVSRLNRTYTAINTLTNQLANASIGDDPLHLNDFSLVRSGINPKKVNVGYEVRKILTDGFKEYFREEGFRDLGVCWRLSAR
jgi:hypothetical protein